MVIAHPLAADQANGILLKPLLHDSLKVFKVAVSEEDLVAGITAV